MGLNGNLIPRRNKIESAPIKAAEVWVWVINLEQNRVTAAKSTRGGGNFVMFLFPVGKGSIAIDTSLSTLNRSIDKFLRKKMLAPVYSLCSPFNFKSKKVKIPNKRKKIWKKKFRQKKKRKFREEREKGWERKVSNGSESGDKVAHKEENSL